MIFIVLMVFYFVFLVSLGYIAHKKSKRTAEDYFLGSRRFGPLILFFTLAATNFSAFTFLGFAGNAYKTGLGQYGIMGFGTAIMAVMFFVIGRKVWSLGKKNNYMTPPELIGERLKSKSVRLLFLFVMVCFTIPYLAVQAIGSGLIIESMTNIDWQIGAVVTVVVITAYVLFGGMKASGWTDVIQGVIMIFALVLAIVFISVNLGGFEQANINALESNPDLFMRPGNGDFFIFQVWFSFMILWILADPMFPQIFSRFYTAKDEKSLKMSMIMYPLVVSFLFLIPVLIGVWAHGTGLEITGGSEDMVLPLMVQNFTPSYIYAFVMIGALAALMSTADSQLLALSTMLSRDLPILKNKISEITFAKILVILLSGFAIIYVLAGYDPNVGIMGSLVSTTFSGLAVLFPTVIAVLYWKKVTKYGCALSIIFGEIFVFIFQYKLLPSYGFLSAIPAVLFSTLILVIVSYFTTAKKLSG